jgi:hypothetical protein
MEAIDKVTRGLISAVVRADSQTLFVIVPFVVV